MTIAERLGMSVEAFWSLSETEQDDWRARAESERDVCKFHGGPVDECADDERDWFPQMSICWPTAQLAAAQALYADLHKDKPYHDGHFKNWAEVRSRQHAFHYADGVSMWLATEDIPGLDFLAGARGLDASEDTEPPSDHA